LKIISQTEKPRFTPGTEWEYSSSGYVILAQILEIVSGRTFASFLEENIFKPLKMNRTVLCGKSRQKIKNIASSYLSSGGICSEIDYAPQNAIYGHNNIYTTIEDMYKWDQALCTEELVSSTAIEEAFASGKTNHGKDIHYGFGWRVGEAEGWRMLSHGGRWLGLRTGILRIPERHFTVLIGANSTEAGISTWMGRIVDRCLD
jgi:CubicO group peptidase (beta-lactamase class C family)